MEKLDEGMLTSTTLAHGDFRHRRSASSLDHCMKGLVSQKGLLSAVPNLAEAITATAQPRTSLARPVFR